MEIFNLQIKTKEGADFKKWLESGGDAVIKKCIAERIRQSSENPISKSDNLDEQLKEVQKALCQFIINTAKEKAPRHAVRALPEAVRVLIELHHVTKLLKQF